MAGKNKITRLPKRLQALVLDMLNKGHTVSAVSEALEKAGADVSRSSVGRFRKDWAENMQDLIEVRAFAEASTKALSAMPESMLTRVNTEILEAALFKTMNALRSNMEEDPEKALKFISKGAMAQMLLAKAKKDDAEKTIKATAFADEQNFDAATLEGENTLTVEFIRPEAKDK